jgi:hypothetical protein
MLQGALNPAACKNVVKMMSRYLLIFYSRFKKTREVEKWKIQE